MTTAKCAAAEVYETKQLIDNRDNKKYWVTKLQDGNCWMSQNLDLDLSKTKALTTVNTDITSNWTPANDTQTGSPSFTGSSSSPDIVQSYDPGEYVYSTPAEQHTCGTVTFLSQCSQYGFVSTARLTADTDPNFISTMGGDAVAGNKYDAHYHVGNYYSWIAALAGTTSVDSSICPKGWQLPINSSTAGTKSYYSVLREYGVNSKLISTDTVPQFDIRLSPLFFVYGGFVSGSSLYYAGSEGIYWTSTATGSSNAYALRFTLSVTPSVSFVGYPRYHGMSVRCVAR